MGPLTRVALCLCCLLGIVGAGTPPNARAAAMSACPWFDPTLREQELQVTRTVWKQNVVPEYAIVHPSRAYGGGLF